LTGNVSLLLLIVYAVGGSLIVVGIFLFYFRDLFFRSSFKYKFLQIKRPKKDMLLAFLNYPKSDGYDDERSSNFLIKWWKSFLSQWNDFFIKNKIVIVAGEASPCIYGEQFIDASRIAKDRGITIKMIAGPFFLKDNADRSYIIEAAGNGIIDLFVAKKRAKRHYWANFFTGELYFEYPHEPNAKIRNSLHFQENRFEVKHYLRRAQAMMKKAIPFRECKINEDYLLLSVDELENLKKCIKYQGKRNINDFTAREALRILRNECHKTA